VAHQLLIYADDMNLLGDDINTIKKNKALIDASKEVGLEVNAEKSKCMLVSRHQNADQNRDVKVADRFFQNVAQFKCLGMTVTNENLIQDEIKKRQISGNACYHSVQKLSSSRLLSKNVRVTLYKTVILHNVLYGCQTWSLTLREEQRQDVREKGAEENIWTEEMK
jgi:folylpolyglutamate synthase/dihydropteroate synthase